MIVPVLEAKFTEADYLREVIRLLKENNAILKDNHEFLLKKDEDLRMIKYRICS
jgi:hypothetical protein